MDAVSTLKSLWAGQEPISQIILQLYRESNDSGKQEVEANGSLKLANSLAMVDGKLR